MSHSFNFCMSGWLELHVLRGAFKPYDICGRDYQYRVSGQRRYQDVQETLLGKRFKQGDGTELLHRTLMIIAAATDDFSP